VTEVGEERKRAFTVGRRGPHGVEHRAHAAKLVHGEHGEEHHGRDGDGELDDSGDHRAEETAEHRVEQGHAHREADRRPLV